MDLLLKSCIQFCVLVVSIKDHLQLLNIHNEKYLSNTSSPTNVSEESLPVITELNKV